MKRGRDGMEGGEYASREAVSRAVGARAGALEEEEDMLVCFEEIVCVDLMRIWERRVGIGYGR